MDNQEKISKINAELARLELEMELDHGGTDEQDYMGFKFSDWFSFSKTTVKPAEIPSDITNFESLVLTEVLIHAKIIPNAIGLPALKKSLVELPFANRLNLKQSDNPHAAWSFMHNSKPIFVFFWAGSASSFSVYLDKSTDSTFNFSTMSVSQVWKNREKISTKNYAYVKGHLYADILVSSGELPFK